MSSIAKKFREVTGISRTDEQKRRESQRVQAQQAAESRARQAALKRADDAAARGRQIQIAGEREAERAEAIARQQEIVSTRNKNAQNVRQRFRRGRGARSTILTSASGITGNRANVARRRLFSILGQSGTA